MIRLLRSLYGRISILYLVLSVALGLLCAWVTMRHFASFDSAVEQKLSRELAGNIAHDISDSLRAGRYEAAVQGIAKHLQMLRPAVELYVLDDAGRILAFSPPREKVEVQQVAVEPIRAFGREEASFPIWGDYPCNRGEQKVFSAAPVTLAGGEAGYLYVILQGKTAESTAGMLQNSYILRTLAFNLLIVFGFTGVVGLVLFGLLTRRFRSRIDTIRQFKAGDYSQRVIVSQDDEIGELGRAFNEMADTIEAQVEALRRTDEARRELVAGVSHDFRTPLTAIRGHAERVLDKHGALAREDLEEHLRTILHNTEQLDRLAEQLHELSRLDAQQAPPDFEAFSIAELVHDIVLKFQPEAEARSITLSANYAPEAPLVYADIGRVDRLISNLVDNALRSTSAGGTVRIDVEPGSRRVRVSVRDTGCGIPSGKIPLVTQRFYQVQRDGEAPLEGSGLGLSVAAEIAELHESTLQIDSVVGKGTSIAFELPVHAPASSAVGP